MKLTGEKGNLFKGRRARLEVLVSPALSEDSDDARTSDLLSDADGESRVESGDSPPSVSGEAGSPPLPSITEESAIVTKEETGTTPAVSKKMKRVPKSFPVRLDEPVFSSYVRRR